MVVGKDTIIVRDRMNADESSHQSASDGLVLASSDLNRLRECASKSEKEIHLERRRAAQAEYEERQSISHERKVRMVALEEERRRNTPLTESERVEEAQKTSLLARAKQALDETREEVQHMNRIVMKSKVAAIRDAQLQERDYLRAERAELERQVDLMMEADRLRALEAEEVKELQRQQNLKQAACVIKDQIAARENQRLREEELRARERNFVLKQIEALKLEEVEQIKNRKEAASRLMDEVNRVNATASAVKEEAILQSKLEDQKIAQYRKNREEAERNKEAQAKAERDLKEAEVARLRASQERAQDKRGELDALRAKRAIEAGERAAREKAAREAQRIASINAELSEARRLQKEEKERMLTEQAVMEKNEFDRALTAQKQQEAADRQRAEDHARSIESFSNELRAQIMAREEKALQERRDQLEEGNVIRAQTINEQSKFEKIRQRKLDDLKRAGVPDKYCSELAKRQV